MPKPKGTNAGTKKNRNSNGARKNSGRNGATKIQTNRGKNAKPVPTPTVEQEDLLAKLRSSISNQLKGNVEITNVEFEGPNIVVYTRDAKIFAKDNQHARSIAHMVRRRVEIRPDPSILAEPEYSKQEILKIIPRNADVGEMYFDSNAGKVTIEAGMPGLAIGKNGAVLNAIRAKVGWVPKIVRIPPIPSKTVSNVREFLRDVQDSRIAILKKIGKRINRPSIKQDNWVRTIALGGYREVGRSCTLLNTRESKVLIDVGMNNSTTGPDISPYLYLSELQPLSTLDAVVVTHAHLDHSGLVPALFLYGYDGPVYCTAPTRDLMSLLQVDSLKVLNAEGVKPLYRSEDIRETIKHCITLDYGETVDISPDLKLTLHNAGHILGSAIAHFHVGDGLYNIAITGDTKYERTWLFDPANTKFPRLEAVLVESTYGAEGDVQPSRDKAKEMLREIVNVTVSRKGHVLIPVFAVGRSQEVMLVLEELMRNHEIPTVPVYLDGMIWEATAIHTAYPEFLNRNLREAILKKNRNPFLSDMFNRVDSNDKREEIINDPAPCIVLATSGMMNGGPVMEYFKNWAEDSRNTMSFVGYQAEGTLGRKIQRGVEEVSMMERDKSLNISVKMDVETTEGFSGHSDRHQLMRFVGNLSPRPSRVVMVHGDEKKCIELGQAISRQYKMDVKVPYNLEGIRYR